jgi:hypothetical protein
LHKISIPEVNGLVSHTLKAHITKEEQYKSGSDDDSESSYSKDDTFDNFDRDSNDPDPPTSVFS